MTENSGASGRRQEGRNGKVGGEAVVFGIGIFHFETGRVYYVRRTLTLVKDF